MRAISPQKLGLKKKMYLNFTRDPKATRSGFGDALVTLGKKYNAKNKSPKIYAVCADLTGSVKMDKFQKAFPKQFVQVGVAEQNLVTVGSGIAAMGKIPFVSSYAAFMPGRCWEQIRTTICYNNQNVKLIGAHAGISVGPDGATHQALEDIATMRSLPNMVVVVPSDYEQTKAATKAIARYKGPVYLRLTRSATPQFTTSKPPFIIGKANVLKQGKDITLIAAGPLVFEAIKAAAILKLKHNISATVIDCHTIKPLDKNTIISAAKKTKRIITIEEHQITGGLGGAVAELLSENHPTLIKRIGVNDHYGESGEPQELLTKFKLDAKNIVKEAVKLCKR